MILLLAIVIAPPVHALASGAVCPMMAAAAAGEGGAMTSPDVGEPLAGEAGCGLHCTAIAVALTTVPETRLVPWRPEAAPPPGAIARTAPLDPGPPRPASIG